MKKILRTLFAPILNWFEKGDEPFSYKPSHRTILLTVGCLFTLLSIAVFVIGLKSDGLGFLLPFIIFGGTGLLSLLIGYIGSDRAVAKIWGSNK